MRQSVCMELGWRPGSRLQTPTGCCGFAIAPRLAGPVTGCHMLVYRPGPRLNPGGVCLLCTRNEATPQDTPQSLVNSYLCPELAFAADANLGSLCGGEKCAWQQICGAFGQTTDIPTHCCLRTSSPWLVLRRLAPFTSSEFLSVA